MDNSRILKFFFLFTIIVIVITTSSCYKNQTEIGNTQIIPLPTQITQKDGYFTINKQTYISVENKEQLEVTKLFLEKFKQKTGWAPKAEIKKNNADIELISDKSLEEEAYKLIVETNYIKITSASEAGFFYAFQTLNQLLPTSFHNQNHQLETSWGIPAVQIKDKPNFKWRGYMLDVSRHFYDKEQIKQVLDFMSEIKLNRFHWHLTDDNGWRIEIKKYPKLTDVGAWRVNHNAKDENTNNWWGRPKQQKGEKATYGGFYTQKDIKEIIAYAKARNIEVVPEIDMPGHSLAAIASYPEISCANGPFYVATGGVVKNNTYCPGKEETFTFVKNVLTEVMDLFPFEYIHIGGDECNKEAWAKDPNCLTRMETENLTNVDELQSYFIKRVEKIINSKNKKMIGWDEILEGGLAPNATVMSWRGEKGGIAAAKQGHDVIMTPSKYCYLDLKQGDDDLEPNLGYAYSFLKDTYNYNPVSNKLTSQQAKHVLGIQGNLWTESITNWSQLTYMTFPRLYAIAENGWTKPSLKNWNNFTFRLLDQLEKLKAKGERFATSTYNVKINHKGHKKGTIDISLSTEANNLNIYYTLDGTEPTLNSQKYTQPFSINKTTTVKATSFYNKKQTGNISTKNFPVHKAVGAKVVYHQPKITNEAELYSLVDLNYGKLNRGDKKWQNINSDLDVDLIFPKNKDISGVEITFLRFTNQGVYLPENIEIYGSNDGVNYTKLSNFNQLKNSHTQGRNKVTSKINFKTTNVKAIKVKAKRVNPIPAGHHRENEASKILLDEIIAF